jgi:branched-chain amino acid transport system substrate-binding protein/neutral amino acid transport system substrate-binding protein
MYKAGTAVRNAFLRLSALGVVVLAPSCSDPAPAPTSAPIEVGTLSSVSGDLASVGLEFNDATSLALEDINASGGVLGRPVKLLVQDDGTTPDGAKEGYPKLLSAKVPFILGPTTSAQVSSIIDLIAGGSTVTIGRTTTADRLRDLPDNGLFYRLCPADVFQARVLVALAVDSGIEHLCLVHRRDIYGNNLAASVMEGLEGSGKGIEITTSEYDPSTSNVSGVIARCDALLCKGGADGGAGGADAGTGGCVAPPPEKVGLMMISFIEDGALLMDDAAQRGWSAQRQKYFFSDGVYDRGILTRVKDVDALEGAIGTSPAGPDPALPEGEPLREFLARYKARFGRDPSVFVENAYDSMYVAAIAMEIAGLTTPGAALNDAMKKVSVPGGKKVHAGDWKGIREAIASKEPIDFVGASGTVDFDEQGDVLPPYNYIIWRIENGQLVVQRYVVVN